MNCCVCITNQSNFHKQAQVLSYQREDTKCRMPQAPVCLEILSNPHPEACFLLNCSSDCFPVVLLLMFAAVSTLSAYSFQPSGSVLGCSLHYIFCVFFCRKRKWRLTGASVGSDSNREWMAGVSREMMKSVSS